MLFLTPLPSPPQSGNSGSRVLSTVHISFFQALVWQYLTKWLWLPILKTVFINALYFVRPWRNPQFLRAFVFCICPPKIICEEGTAAFKTEFLLLQVHCTMLPPEFKSLACAFTVSEALQICRTVFKNRSFSCSAFSLTILSLIIQIILSYEDSCKSLKPQFWLSLLIVLHTGP